MFEKQSATMERIAHDELTEVVAFVTKKLDGIQDIEASPLNSSKILVKTSVNKSILKELVSGIVYNVDNRRYINSATQIINKFGFELIDKGDYVILSFDILVDLKRHYIDHLIFDHLIPIICICLVVFGLFGSINIIYSSIENGYITDISSAMEMVNGIGIILITIIAGVIISYLLGNVISKKKRIKALRFLKK